MAQRHSTAQCSAFPPRRVARRSRRRCGWKCRDGACLGCVAVPFDRLKSTLTAFPRFKIRQHHDAVCNLHLFSKNITKYSSAVLKNFYLFSIPFLQLFRPSYNLISPGLGFVRHIYSRRSPSLRLVRLLFRQTIFKLGNKDGGARKLH